MRTISVNQTTEIYTMQCNRMINILTGFEAAYNMRTHTHTHMHNKNTTIDNERCLKLYKSYHLLQFHSGWRLYFANFIGSFMHYLRCRAFRSIHISAHHWLIVCCPFCACICFDYNFNYMLHIFWDFLNIFHIGILRGRKTHFYS